MDNLAYSNVSPRAVNGSVLDPIGKIPNVAFCTNDKTVHDDVHIYASVTGALISWATAKKLQKVTLDLWDKLTSLTPVKTPTTPSQLEINSCLSSHLYLMDRSAQCQGRNFD